MLSSFCLKQPSSHRSTPHMLRAFQFAAVQLCDFSVSFDRPLNTSGGDQHTAVDHDIVSEAIRLLLAARQCVLDSAHVSQAGSAAAQAKFTIPILKLKRRAHVQKHADGPTKTLREMGDLLAKDVPAKACAYEQYSVQWSSMEVVPIYLQMQMHWRWTLTFAPGQGCYTLNCHNKKVCDHRGRRLINFANEDELLAETARSSDAASLKPPMF